MSYVSTVTGSSGVTANSRTFTLPSTGVQVGDLVLAVLPIVGHVLSPGYGSYQAARLALPARWVWIGASTVQRGGDPARLQEAVLVAALVAEASDVGATWTFTSLAESPLADSTWETSYPAKPHAHVFRGEVGVNAAHWVAPASSVSSVTPAEGWTPDGTGTDVVEALAAHAYTATTANGSTSIVWAPNDLRIANKAGAHPASYDASTGVADTMSARALFDGDTAITAIPVVGTVSVSATRSPLKPDVTSPAAGAIVDARANGLDVAWTYLASTAGAQTGYAIRRSYGSTVEYWSGTAWGASEVIVSSSDAKITLPSGTAWTYGTTYALSVATKGFSGVRGEYSDPISVQVATAPTLTVAVTGQASDGTVADATPTVTGTATTGSGLSVAAWEAQITDQAGVLVDAGSGVGSTLSWTTAALLTNGASYNARMRVQQTGGMWSSWATKAFRILIVDVPVVVDTATWVANFEHETSGAPGVAVYVGLGGSLPIATTPTVVELERTIDGLTYVPLGTYPVPAGQAWVEIHDWAAPTGRAVSYRARGISTVNGADRIGDWGLVGPLDVPATLAGWLIDIDRPELAIRTTLIAREADDIDTGNIAYALIGKAAAVVAHGTPTLASRKVTVRVDTQVELANVLEMLTGGNLLALRWCQLETPDGGLEVMPDTYGLPVGHVAIAQASKGMSWQNVAFTLVDQVGRP